MPSVILFTHFHEDAPTRGGKQLEADLTIYRQVKAAGYDIFTNVNSNKRADCYWVDFDDDEAAVEFKLKYL